MSRLRRRLVQTNALGWRRRRRGTAGRTCRPLWLSVLWRRHVRLDALGGRLIRPNAPTGAHVRFARINYNGRYSQCRKHCPGGLPQNTRRCSCGTTVRAMIASSCSAVIAASIANSAGSSFKPMDSAAAPRWHSSNSLNSASTDALRRRTSTPRGIGPTFCPLPGSRRRRSSCGPLPAQQDGRHGIAVPTCLAAAT